MRVFRLLTKPTLRRWAQRWRRHRRSPSIESLTLGIEAAIFFSVLLFTWTGDLLFAFTDGLTEALNTEGEEFGEVRVKETLAASADYQSMKFETKSYDELKSGASVLRIMTI